MNYQDLIINLSLLISLSAVSGLVEKRWTRDTRMGRVLQGLLFGSVAALGMIRAMQFFPGVRIDGRSILISLGAFFYGPLTAAISAGCAVILRLYLGDIGVLTGILIILASACIGVAAHYRYQPQKRPPRISLLFFFGLAVHGAMTALLFVLPREISFAAVAQLSPYILTLFPLATILIGTILSNQFLVLTQIDELREKDQFYRVIMEHLPVGIAVNKVYPQIEFSYMNDRFPKIYRTTKEALSVPDAFWKEVYEEPEQREKMRKQVVSDCRSGEPDRMFWENIPVHRQGETAAYINARNTPIPGTDMMVSTVWDVTQRKLVEDRLKESEEKHRRLFESMSQGVVYQDAEGKITSANPAAQHILGISFEQMQGRTSMDPLWNMVKDDGTQVSGHDHPAMIALRTGEKTGPVVRGINRQERDDYVWLSIIATPLFQPGETKPSQVYSTFEDITEVRWYERNYQMLFREMLDGFALLEILDDGQEENADYCYLAVNPAFERMMQVHSSEIIGKRVSEMFTRTKTTWIRNYSRVLRTGEPVRFEQYVQEMDAYFLVSSFSPQSGQVACFFQDITEEKQYYNKLQEQRQIFRNLYESSPDAIAILDREDRVVDLNRSFALLFGYTLDEAKGRYINDLIVPETQYTEARELTELVKSNQIVGKDTLRCNKDGTPIEVTLVGYPNTIEGHQIGMFGIYRDISDKKKMEEQLIQSQKMEGIGRLAGGIAHDFNNMLGVILGYTEMLLEHSAPAQPMHGALKEVYEAARRSSDLTNQLLAFARRQPVEPKTLNLNTVIDQMFTMLQRLVGDNIQMSWIPSKDIGWVKLDPSQVDQILVNLCINAREAIEDTGRIIIETHKVILTEEHCAHHADCVPGEYVQLVVSDDGCGMDKTTRSHVFEPFFTTKEIGNGTGLGLPTVYGIVQQNNGIIHIYSEPDNGTTFEIYLPVHREQAHDESPLEQDTETDLFGHETILIVDDDKQMLSMAAEMIRQLGYRAVTALTLQEAVEAAQKHWDIALLITDVVMPEKNGKELYATLLQYVPHLKVLYMSGYTSNVVVHRGIVDDEIEFLQKPFTKKEAARKIRNALERKRSSK